MASGAPLATKGLKGRSTTDVTSIASSDFEEVRLEDLDTASEEVDWSPHSEEEMNSKRTSPQKKGIVGKNSTAPVPTRRSLELSSEQYGAATLPSEIEASQEPAVPVETEGAQARDDGGTGPAPNAVNVYGDPIYDPLKEIETTAVKAAELAQEAAKQVSVKFLGSANEAVSEAKMSLTKLAGDVSSWWASLDPSRQTASDVAVAEPSTAKATDASSEVQALFGLPETEEVMDSFSCSLQQTFTCSHNTFTPTREVSLPGKLHITDKTACFKASEEDVSFTVPLKDIVKASKSTIRNPGSKPAVLLKLQFAEAQWAQFGAFAKTGDVDSVLALVEHLNSESA